MNLREFIGLHGRIFYRKPGFYDLAIRSRFELIKKGTPVMPGETVWVHQDAIDGQEGVSGFELCSVSDVLDIPQGPRCYMYCVQDDARLLRLLLRQPLAYQRRIR